MLHAVIGEKGHGDGIVMASRTICFAHDAGAEAEGSLPDDSIFIFYFYRSFMSLTMHICHIMGLNAQYVCFIILFFL